MSADLLDLRHLQVPPRHTPETQGQINAAKGAVLVRTRYGVCLDAALVVYCLVLLMVLLCPASANSPTAPYHLRPGDVVQITVAGHPELTFDSRNPIEIRADGRLSYPFAGEIMAAGKTIEQITGALVDALGHHLRAPQVAVNVIRYRDEEIYVLGEVNKPGAYALPQDRDVGIREAIALAAGLTPEASRETARLFRAGAPSTLLDLAKILAGDSEAEIGQLQAGDTLVIERRNIVSVIGEVEKPGSYQLPDGGTVADALAMAEGFAKDYGTGSSRANRSQAVLIRADKTVVPINLAAILSGNDPQAAMPMHSGDTLLIPEVNNQVVVLGEVRQPGSYYLASEEKLSAVLAMGGGVTSNGDSQHIRIIGPDSTVLTVNYEPVFREGAEEPDVWCYAGDTVIVPTNRQRAAVFGFVNQPGVYPLESGDTILDLIGKARGLVPEKSAPQHTVLMRQGASGGEPMRVNLRDLTEGRDPEPLVVQDGDVIFVPESKKLHWQDWTELITSIVNVWWLFDRF